MSLYTIVINRTLILHETSVTESVVPPDLQFFLAVALLAWAFVFYAGWYTSTRLLTEMQI